ncbi:MAG: folylpolyglutamate synthase/dihydrofolate synthase family protein [Opitutus sp.]
MNPDYAVTRDYLIGLKARGVRPGLDRIRLLAAALGHPERAIPCVHVAGTNGKGSVAAMIEAMLRAAGWRTGLYTSPHLVRLGERIQVNRRAIQPDQIASGVSELRPVAESLAGREGDEMHPSYFEFMSALAFRHFAREQCDIAIIETGMGGRLDATNIVDPELAIITSIGLDHCEFLGDTLEKIAAEKAGIIKPSRPAVIGLLPPAAEHVIRKMAIERGAPLVSVAERYGTEPSRLPPTNLAGEHQRVNAATATLAAQSLPDRWRLGPEVIASALNQIDWPGRWQRIHVGGRTLILDGAHNAGAAPALDRSLAELAASTGKPPVVVMGVLGASRAAPLLEAVCRHAREIHLVVPGQSRACSHGELETLAPPECRNCIRRSNTSALFPAPGTCTAGEAGDIVVVTGSLFLVGEVLVRLDPSRGPFEGDLQDF